MNLIVWGGAGENLSRCLENMDDAYQVVLDPCNLEDTCYVAPDFVKPADMSESDMAYGKFFFGKKSEDITRRAHLIDFFWSVQ